MEHKFSYRDSKGITHKRIVTGEFYQHGKRVYEMIDPVTNDPHTGIADEIDRNFLPKRESVLPRSKKGLQTINKRRACYK